MKKKNNAIFTSLFILGICSILFAYILNNSSKTSVGNSQSVKKEVVDTLSINSEIIREYMSSYISFSKNLLEVFINGKKIYEYVPRDNCYLDNVHYDRIGKVISINECKPIEKYESTTIRILALRAIDYISRNIYSIIDSVECSDDGEQSYFAHIINFNAKDTSGIIYEGWWEGFGFSSWKKGIKESLELSGNDHEYDSDEVLAILDSTKYLINSIRGGVSSWVIYDTFENSVIKIDTSDLAKYRDITLKQFGHKKVFVDGKWSYMSNLNYNGTISFRQIDNYLYELTDLPNGKKYFLKSDKSIVPIWQ